MRDIVLTFGLVPLVGAIIGWITNVLAVKLLFRPYRVWRLPVLGYEVQGLIPRRRGEIAKSIGEAIERELLTPEMLLGQMLTPEVKAGLGAMLVDTVEQRVREKLPALLPPGIARALLDFVRAAVEKEATATLEDITGQVADQVKGNLKLSALVEERLAQLDLAELEKLILRLSGRELRHIEILGGVLGFLIGLGQAAIMYFAY